MWNQGGFDRQCDQSVQIGTRHRHRHQRWRKRRMAGQETFQTRGGEGGQPGTWPGLRDARPKRGGVIGVRGDRAPSSLVFVKLRGRKIEGAEHENRGCGAWQILGVFFFFFFFFLYHAFLVFRYKKLPAALAREKTKPINLKRKLKKAKNNRNPPPS